MRSQRAKRSRIPSTLWKEIPFDTIKISKYRKGVTLEAIAEKGYDAAVQDTDEEFKTDLQKRCHG